MTTISKSKLRKIIQEELKKELVDEGIFDTFKELGSDAQKWYQDAAKRGTVKAGDRGARRMAFSSARFLQKELQKLTKICGPDGEKCNQKVKDQIKNLKSTIQAFKQSPDATVGAMVDASDGDMDASPGSNIAKMYKNLDKVTGELTASRPQEPEAAPGEAAEAPEPSSEGNVEDRLDKLESALQKLLNKSSRRRSRGKKRRRRTRRLENKQSNS